MCRFTFLGATGYDSEKWDDSVKKGTSGALLKPPPHSSALLLTRAQSITQTCYPALPSPLLASILAVRPSVLRNHCGL